MKIVVLDGYALNPGDLSWDDLRALGDCVVHDRTSAAEVVGRMHDAEVVLTNKTVLGPRELAQAPALRYIGVLATGTNVVDLNAAKAKGIPVTNVPAYSTASVAQLTFALLLELAMHVGDHARGVRELKWSASPDFSYWDSPLMELAGLRMGIVGFGGIGQAVARVAQALGMQVAAFNPRLKPGWDGVTFMDLDALFRSSDVVSLHCPLTPDTRELVNARSLELMKPTALLLNTGRGGLVNEQALAAALNSGRIAGAGLDVLSTEPPHPDNPLLKARNCVITPHFGWATKAARVRLMRTAVENVRAFLGGKPQNVVAP